MGARPLNPAISTSLKGAVTKDRPGVHLKSYYTIRRTQRGSCQSVAVP